MFRSELRSVLLAFVFQGATSSLLLLYKMNLVRIKDIDALLHLSAYCSSYLKDVIALLGYPILSVLI